MLRTDIRIQDDLDILSTVLLAGIGDYSSPFRKYVFVIKRGEQIDEGVYVSYNTVPNDIDMLHAVLDSYKSNSYSIPSTNLEKETVGLLISKL